MTSFAIDDAWQHLYYLSHPLIHGEPVCEALMRSTFLALTAKEVISTLLSPDIAFLV
jgi:hypothetical protein